MHEEKVVLLSFGNLFIASSFHKINGTYSRTVHLAFKMCAFLDFPDAPRTISSTL
jgi:hypothetical protein